jgi:hypothetical protein
MITHNFLYLQTALLEVTDFTMKLQKESSLLCYILVKLKYASVKSYKFYVMINIKEIMRYNMINIE